MSVDHSAEGDVDCHSIAGTIDTAGLGCVEGTDHDSPDWVVLGTFAGSLTVGWCTDEYYSQRPVPEASSSWPPSLCTYYQ